MTRPRRATAPPPCLLQVLQQELQATQQLLLRQPTACLLCGQPGLRVALFLPDDPQAFGVPQGWDGARFYVLCLACGLRSDRDQAVEATILAQERRQAAFQWRAPWN